MGESLDLVYMLMKLFVEQLYILVTFNTGSSLMIPQQP